MPSAPVPCWRCTAAYWAGAFPPTASASTSPATATECHCWRAASSIAPASVLSTSRRALSGLPPHSVPPLHYAKGNYYALAGRAPFSHLIYPVPESAGLGVHLTLDLGGQARFGPDVEWIDGIDYTVDPRRADAFYAEVRRYWPELSDGALQPAYAGIRPKLHAPGAAACDFAIAGPRDHGVPGLVNFFGIESPGLTASLALAAHAAELLAKT
jgi:L-2-hydroxyglutarate oxidase LhgO